MKIKNGDIVVCKKERIENSSDNINMHFKVNNRYEVNVFLEPNSTDKYNIFVSDGGGFMLQFDDGIKEEGLRHPNFWEYFMTEKELLNKKLNKVKNV